MLGVVDVITTSRQDKREGLYERWKDPPPSSMARWI